MKGDYWEVMELVKTGRVEYRGYARFEMDHPPFEPRAVEREIVRFFWRPRLPWHYDLPGVGADQGKVFGGPIEYAEWFALKKCYLNGEVQAYGKTGKVVWDCQVSDGVRAVLVEVFIDDRPGQAMYNGVEIVNR